jgi:methylenetetrahydrofolate dehydrogenase (NADP+)/methenyltetrahydrofolate cyclohydrolase
LIDGRPIARRIWDDVGRRAERVRAQSGAAPHLAIVRGSGDPAADSYLRQIVRGFGEAGLVATTHELPPDADPPVLSSTLRRLDADTSVHGVLIQVPLPAALTLELAVQRLSPAKDVEGVHPESAGLLAQGRAAVVPSTPQAGLEMLRAEGVEIAGRHAVVVGRSAVVGRPLALLLLGEHATVTICHSRTRDLDSMTKQADILLVAAGRAGLVNGAAIKQGAVVIDFGVNAVEGRLIGDVDAESAMEVAGAITRVPGGTGPVTTALLGRNLVSLAERAMTRGKLGRGPQDP